MRQRRGRALAGIARDGRAAGARGVRAASFAGADEHAGRGRGVRARAARGVARSARGLGRRDVMRVLAAMSGGVDSAVAAALAAEAGCEVTGVTLKLWCYGHGPSSPRACCTVEAVEDARQTARRMNFPHHVVNAEDLFRERVLEPFARGYAAGRTPYPCALCNQHLKFGDLLARMELVGADRLVTGHYARVAALEDGSWGLFRAVDRDKDQSYALAFVPYAALARVHFPLGDLTKDQVRAHASRLGLAGRDKPGSPEPCFAPDGDYAAIVDKALGAEPEPGTVVDPA